MKKDEPMRNINPFGLRLQAELKARIEAAAAQNHRSINAEIVARLEASFEQSFTFADAVIVDEVHRSEPKFSEADIKTAIDQVFGKLLFERVGFTATPTAKKPIRKRTRPLGMDQKDWEAQQQAENASADSDNKPKRRSALD